MAKSLIAFACVVAVSLAQGPTQPDSRARCDKVGNKAVDGKNMCWYHECTLSDRGDGSLQWLPRTCALGSKVSYNFVQGQYNPCTINFDDVIGYECGRSQPSIDGPPACFESWRCFNGGTKRFEANLCWCTCPITWKGNFDCSIPTQDLKNLPPRSNICVDGKPKADHCQLSGGCLNGGTCYNQCDTFWCECPNRKTIDYYGKRCELKP